jgi:hypothetical protein
MSSGAFVPVGARAGLTHDAGRTSFSPYPLSAACLNACCLEFALTAAIAAGSVKPERAAPHRTRIIGPTSSTLESRPPTQVGARNRRLI